MCWPKAYDLTVFQPIDLLLTDQMPILSEQSPAQPSPKTLRGQQNKVLNHCLNIQSPAWLHLWANWFELYYVILSMLSLYQEQGPPSLVTSFLAPSLQRNSKDRKCARPVLTGVEVLIKRPQQIRDMEATCPADSTAKLSRVSGKSITNKKLFICCPIRVTKTGCT